MVQIDKIETVTPESTKAGDILLCFAPEAVGKDEGLASGYSHAAICYAPNKVIESSGAGVKETNIENLLREYSHIAVLRNDELWSESRINALCEFLSKKIGKPFNNLGLGKYQKRKKENQDNAMEQVIGFFEGKISPSSPDRDVYFCSELVTSAFIHVGIIEDSAAVLFRPETFSPEDIGSDKAFGFFVGYIFPCERYELPKNDMFKDSI
jgi:uncharacterized protein YycO